MNAPVLPLTINIKYVFVGLILLQLLLAVVPVRRLKSGGSASKASWLINVREVDVVQDVDVPLRLQMVTAAIILVVGGLLVWAMAAGWVDIYVPPGFDPDL